MISNSRKPSNDYISTSGFKAKHFILQVFLVVCLEYQNIIYYDIILHIAILYHTLLFVCLWTYAKRMFMHLVLLKNLIIISWLSYYILIVTSWLLLVLNDCFKKILTSDSKSKEGKKRMEREVEDLSMISWNGIS